MRGLRAGREEPDATAVSQMRCSREVSQMRCSVACRHAPFSFPVIGIQHCMVIHIYTLKIPWAEFDADDVKFFASQVPR